MLSAFACRTGYLGWLSLPQSKSQPESPDAKKVRVMMLLGTAEQHHVL